MNPPEPSKHRGDSGLSERDPHLLAALQHAPDRDAVAPAELSRRIAQQARRAVQAPLKTASGAAPRVHAAWPWLGAQAAMRLMSTWWTWLLQPARAGVLGTVLVAGFISLMWRDGVPPEALPGPVQNSPPELQSKDLAGPAHGAASAAGSILAATAREASATGPAKVATVSRAREGMPAPRLAMEPKADDRAEAQAADTAPKTAPQPSAHAATNGPSTAAPVLAASKLPAAEVDAAANRGLATEAPAPAPAPASLAGLLQAESRAGAAAPAARRSPTVAPFVPSAKSMREAENSSLADPLAAPLAQLAAGAADSLQVQATRDQLLRVQRAAPGLWRAVPPQLPAVGHPVLDADGRLLGHLLLQGRDLRWQNAQGSWRARLPETAAPLWP